MPAATPNRLLQPSVLARLGTLELVSKTVVDGVLIGLHRSPNFGFSQEFAEYRAYNEGDDLRFVDWNVYARTDRTYVKRFRGETNSPVTLLLDASASMQYGTPVSKLDWARFLLASLSYLVRRQHDALGLAVFDERVRRYLPPSSKPDALNRALALLERTEAGQGTDIAAPLHALQASMQRRGLVILVSDLYTNPETLFDGLRPLAHAGQDIAIFHVLDPGEKTPELRTISALESMESGRSVTVDPDFMRSAYRDRLQAHIEAISERCAQTGADYREVSTAQPLDEALHQYLLFRERRAR